MATNQNSAFAKVMSASQTALALAAATTISEMHALSMQDQAKVNREARFSLRYAKGSPMSSLSELINAGGLSVHRTTDTVTLSEANLISLAAPDMILLSKTAPGNHVLSLSGVTADEAIARLLSQALNTQSAVSDFGRVLATPENIAKIMLGLFGARIDVPIKGRVQKLSEGLIASRVAKELKGKGPEVRAAYAHICARVLELQGFLVASTPTHVVHRTDTLVASHEEIKAALLVQSLRGIFDDSRIKRMLDSLEESVTPFILAEKMGMLFREYSFAMPQVARDAARCEKAAFTVTEFLRNPASFPLELQGNDAVQTLARYANFITLATSVVDFDPTSMIASIEERRVACEYVLVAINATPTLESMSMSSFAQLFYSVSAQGTDGGRRGVVLGQRAGQQATMTVVNAVEAPGILQLSEVDPTNVLSSGLAPLVTSSLGSETLFTGVMDLLADHLRDLMDDVNQPFEAPILLGFQVSDSDLKYLAMATCNSLLVVAKDAADPLRAVTVVYGVSAKPGWRMAVVASDGKSVFFTDPASVVLYTADVEPRIGKPLPIRPQSIGTRIMQDMNYLETEKRFMNKSVSEPFVFTIPVRGIADPVPLTIPVLSQFLMDPSGAVAGSAITDAYYAGVKEPGSDNELLNLFNVLAHFLSGKDDLMRDRAASLLAVSISALLKHPVVLGVAQQAIALSFATLKIDMRSVQSQREQVLVRAILGTALAFLNRFGKVTAKQLQDIIAHMPISSITANAQLSLSQLPSLYNRIGSVG